MESRHFTKLMSFDSKPFRFAKQLAICYDYIQGASKNSSKEG